jgi:hypothetical protein
MFLSAIQSANAKKTYVWNAPFREKATPVQNGLKNPGLYSTFGEIGLCVCPILISLS